MRSIVGDVYFAYRFTLARTFTPLPLSSGDAFSLRARAEYILFGTNCLRRGPPSERALRVSESPIFLPIVEYFWDNSVQE